jgi:hypothetical protein
MMEEWPKDSRVLSNRPPAGAAGARLGALDTGHIKGQKVMTFLYQGWAQV